MEYFSISVFPFEILSWQRLNEPSVWIQTCQRNEEALEMMEKAIAADKKNPLPKYQKSLILLGLMKYEEALDELERLKEIAPHESSMYALMGKIYKQLNILDKAVFCFGIALDLKPPAADLAIIKV